MDARFRDAEAAFVNLRARYQSGALSAEKFKAAVEANPIEYDGGYWMLGVSSGKWYRYDGANWTQANPPPSAVAPPSRSAKAAAQRPTLEGSKRADPVPRPSVPTAAAMRSRAKTSESGASPKSVWVFPPLDSRLKGIEFLPESATLVATSFDPDARVLHIGGNLWNTLRVGEDKYLLDAIDSSGDGRLLFCAGIGRQSSGVWVWKTDAIGFGQQVAPWRKMYDAPVVVRSIASSYDGSRLAVGLSDGSVSLVDGASGRELNRLTASRRSIGHVAISADGSHVAASGQIETWVKLWESSSGRELHEWRDGSADSLEFSRDGNLLLAVLRGVVITWKVPSGNAGARLVAKGVKYDRAVFSSDGHRIIAAGRSASETTSSVVLCETKTGRQVRTIGKIDSSVEHIAVSRDSSFAACGGSDRRVHVLSI